MSEDNCIDPEHDVFDVLVVIVVVSISSENVTDMLLLIDTPVWLSLGEMEAIVGAVVSITNAPIFRVTAFPRLSVILILQSE